MSYELIETNYGKSALVTRDDSPSTSYNKDAMDILAHHGILGMKWGIRRYQPYGHGGYDPENKGHNTGQASKILASMHKAGEQVSESLSKKKKQRDEKKAKDKAVKEQNRLAEEEWKRQEYLKKEERKREDKADRAEFKAQEKIQKREAEQARKEQMKALDLQDKKERDVNKKEEKMEERRRRESEERIKRTTDDILAGKRVNTRDLSDEELRAVSNRVNSENTLRTYANTAAKNAAEDAKAGKSWVRTAAEQAAIDLGTQMIENGKKAVIDYAKDWAMQAKDPAGYALKKELEGLKKKTDELNTRQAYADANNKYKNRETYYMADLYKQKGEGSKNMKAYNQNMFDMEEMLKKRGRLYT